MSPLVAAVPDQRDGGGICRISTDELFCRLLRVYILLSIWNCDRSLEGNEVVADSLAA